MNTNFSATEPIKQEYYSFHDEETSGFLVAVPKPDNTMLDGSSRWLSFNVYRFSHSVWKNFKGETGESLFSDYDSSVMYYLPFEMKFCEAGNHILTIGYRAGYDERISITPVEDFLEVCSGIKELVFIHEVIRQLIPLAQLWTGKPL